MITKQVILILLISIAIAGVGNYILTGQFTSASSDSNSISESVGIKIAKGGITEVGLPGEKISEEKGIPEGGKGGISGIKPEAGGITCTSYCDMETCSSHGPDCMWDGEIGVCYAAMIGDCSFISSYDDCVGERAGYASPTAGCGWMGVCAPCASVPPGPMCNEVSGCTWNGEMCIGITYCATCDYDPMCCGGNGGFTTDGGMTCFYDPGCSSMCTECSTAFPPMCDMNYCANPSEVCMDSGLMDGGACMCCDPSNEMDGICCDYESSSSPDCCVYSSECCGGYGGYTPDYSTNCYDDSSCTDLCLECTKSGYPTCGGYCADPDEMCVPGDGCMCSTAECTPDDCCLGDEGTGYSNGTDCFSDASCTIQSSVMPEGTTCDADIDSCTNDVCDAFGSCVFSSWRDTDADLYIDWLCDSGNDCDDLDWNINPGAIENCINGIDDNCDGNTDCADMQCSSDPACLPIYTEFNGATTDFSGVPDLTQVIGCILEDTTYGMITWTDLMGVNVVGADLDANINIGNGFISINEAGLDPSLGGSAHLKIYNFGCAGFTQLMYQAGFFGSAVDVISGGIDCVVAGMCQNVVCADNTLEFDVGALGSGYAPLPPGGGTVGACGTINSPGYYNVIGPLTDPIPNDVVPCISIESNDVIFDCQGFSITNGVNDDAIVFNSSNVTIMGCSVSNCGDAVFCNAGSEFVIYNNTFSNNNDDGIELSTCAYGNITLNTINVNTMNGILSAYTNHTVIDDNGITMNGNTGIDSDHDRDFTISRNSILSNTIAGIEASADNDFDIGPTNTIQLNNNYGIDASGSVNFVIHNNTINSNSWDGILIAADLFFNITDNQIFANGFAIAGHGVNFDGTDFSIVADNAVYNNFGEGVFVFSGSDNNWVRRNNVTGNQADGVRIASNSNYNNVSDNNVTSNIVMGIWIGTSCQNNTVWNNFIAWHPTNGRDNGANNKWNIAKSPGPNIIAGKNISGNYWDDYTGADTTGDGIGDTLLSHLDGALQVGNGDFGPLKNNIYIYNCTNITTSGIYALYNDIISPPDLVCIKINASNVIIYGDGQTISGTSVSGSKGIYTFLSGAPFYLNNITIKDLTVKSWEYGIHFYATENSTIDHVTANLNTFRGLKIDYSSFDNITNSNIDSSTGMSVFGSSNVTIRNNSIKGYAYIGLDLDSCDHALVDNNTIDSSKSDGIHVTSTILPSLPSHDNRFTNNLIINNGFFDGSTHLYGIEFGDGDAYNIFINNTLYGNDGWDLRADYANELGTATGNIFGSNYPIKIDFTYGVSGIAMKGVASPPSDPSGLHNISNYLNATDFGSGSWLNINVSYTNSELGNVNESTLSIARYNGSWETDTSKFANNYGIDTANNVVYANITGFGSTFVPLGNLSALGAPNPPISKCTNITTTGYHKLNTTIYNSLLTVCMNITVSDVTLDCDNNIIEGIGTAGTYGVMAKNVKNIVVENCNIDEWGTGVFFDHTNNSEISNNNLYDPAVAGDSNDIGAYLSYSHNNNISYNVIVNSTDYGIYNSYGDNDTFKFNNISYSHNYNGMRINMSNNNVIDSNTIYKNAYMGIEVEYSAHGNITNNTVYDNYGTGIFTSGYGFYPSDYYNIINNTVRNNGYGITVQGAHTKVRGNNILNNNYSAVGVWAPDTDVISNNITNSSFGVLLPEGNNCTIDNNTIINNSYGIYLACGYYCCCSDVTISNNTVRNTRYNGISASQSADNNTIYNNTIINSTNGIYFDDIRNNNISNNYIYNSTNAGLLTISNMTQHTTSYNRIFNNTFAGSGYAGIVLTNSSYNNLTDNILYNNNRDFISVDTLVGNNINNLTLNNTVVNFTYATTINMTYDNGASTPNPVDYAKIPHFLNITGISASYTPWNVTFGGTGSDVGYSVQQTSDGGYIIAGQYDLGSSNSAILLIKTNSTGGQVWNRTFGSGSNRNIGYSVQQTSDGGYIIGGEYDSTYAILIKTNSTGQQVWNKTFGWGGKFYSVKQTSDGGYIATGYNLTNSGDVFVVKTNSTGGITWQKDFDYGTSWNYGQSVIETNDSNFVIAGFTGAGLNGGEDVWVIKTNSTGSALWNKSIGGAGNDGGYDVIEGQTSDHYLYIVGYYNGSSNKNCIYIQMDKDATSSSYATFGGTGSDECRAIAIGPSGDMLLIGSTNSYGAGGTDVWLLRVNVTTFVAKWNRTFGGASNDVGYSGIMASDGSYVMAGSTASYGSGGDVWLVKAYESGTPTTSSWLNLNISYNNPDIFGIVERSIFIARYNGSWETDTSKFANNYGIDTANNVVYANISNFGSIFAPLGESMNVSNCKNLTWSDTVYTLIANLSGVQAGRDVCIDVQADNVTLDCDGHNLTDSVPNSDYGILSDTNKNITIKNCLLYFYDTGIAVWSNNNTSLIGNTVINASYGLDMEDNNYTKIIQNTIINSTDEAIYVSGESYSNISNNILDSNKNYGIHAYDSNDTDIMYNSINNTGSKTGVYGECLGIQQNSNRLKIMYNNFTNSGDVGISISDSSNNTVFMNLIKDNAEGVLITDAAHYNNISNNDISGKSGDGFSSLGIWVYAQASNNIFVNNNDTGFDEYFGTSCVSVGPPFNNTIINLTLDDAVVSFTYRLGLNSEFDIIDLNNTFPADPASYANASIYVKIKNGTTSSPIFIAINMSYNESKVINESKLFIGRYNESGVWELNESKFANNFGVNTVNNYVYANITTIGYRPGYSEYSSIFAPLEPAIGQLNVTVLINGTKTSNFTNAGQPYNVTVIVKDNSTGDPVADATVAFTEYVGYVPFALIQKSDSNFTNAATAFSTTDANGFVQFTVIPTGGPIGYESYLGNYSIDVEVEATSYDPYFEEFNVTNRGPSYAVPSYPVQVPNEGDLEYINAYILRVYDRIQGWLGPSVGGGENHNVTVFDNGTVVGLGFNFILGKPTGLNVTVIDSTSLNGIDSAYVILREQNSFLTWSILQKETSNISNVVSAGTTTDSNGNVRFTVVATGGSNFTGLDSYAAAIGTHNITLSVAWPNGTTIVTQTIGVDSYASFPIPAKPVVSVPNQESNDLEYYNAYILRLYDRLQGWLNQ